MPRATRSAQRAAEAAADSAKSTTKKQSQEEPTKDQTQKGRGRGRSAGKVDAPKEEEIPKELSARGRRGASKETPPPAEAPARGGRGRRGKATEPEEVVESGDAADTTKVESPSGRGTRGRKTVTNTVPSPAKTEVKSRSKARQSTQNQQEQEALQAEPIEPSPRGRQKKPQTPAQSPKETLKSPTRSRTRGKGAVPEHQEPEQEPVQEEVPVEPKLAKTDAPTKGKITPKKMSSAEATVVSTDVEMTQDEKKVQSMEQEPPVVKVDEQPPVQKDQPGTSAAPQSALSPSGHKRKWSYPDDDLGMSPPKKRREVADESSVPVTASAVQAAEQADKSADNELGEYEVIQMSDVPAADSQEVAAAVPKLSQPGVESMETEEAPVNFTSSQSASASVVLPPVNQTVQKQPLSQPAMINGNNSNESTVDPLLNRNFIPNPHLQGPVDSSKKFSVVSYNILAECHRKRGDYSFTPEEYLDISYRHKRMMEELKYLDGDVLCLQEVDPDYYRDVLSKDLRSLGYEGVFKKRNSPHYNEGEATFWRTSRFTLVDNTPLLLQDILQKDVDALEQSDADKAAIRKYLEGPIVMLITRLKCNITGTVLTVGNVHVIWGKLKLTDIQCMQAAAAVREVVNKAGGAHNPHIVCGDFNSFPESCAYQLLQDGYLSDNSINQLQEVTNVELSNHSKAALVNLLWKGFQHTSPHLKSAYATVQGQEPLVSSSNNLFTLCVDYIWGSVNDQLKLTGVTEVAKIDHHIPTVIFPSDHISLQTEFAFA